MNIDNIPTSQCDRILAHLQKGRKLTALEALARFDCFRLSARISDLKERGYPIKTDMITLKNGKIVAEYKLDTDAA